MRLARIGRKGLKTVSERKVGKACSEEMEEEALTRCQGEARGAMWRALDLMRKDGFVALADIVTGGGEMEAGIRSASPVAVLGAPLKGYMVYVSPRNERSRRVVVRLVSPDNRKAWDLGYVTAPTDLAFDGDGEERSVPANKASVDFVGVVKKGKALLMGLSMHTGGHCSETYMTHYVAAIPTELLGSK